ncbi:MAG: acetyl-CoA carboxylase biotin carboxyl carrier protein [Candidatus Rifleibacteriota bacterium]
MPKAKTTVSKTSIPSDKIFNQVVEIIEFMGKNKLAEIELETSDIKLKLKKHSAVVAAHAPVVSAIQPAPIPFPSSTIPNVGAASVSKEKEEEQKEEADNEFHKIVSPMAGTFYRAPSPTSAPFVKEGDNVTVGQTVCIVEAMKMMNEIKADKAGKIVKILKENGQPVDKGAELFFIGE